MRTKSVAAVLLPICSGWLLPCDAHHSVTAEYDPLKQGTIEGVVSEVWFNHPHVRYYIEVEDEHGDTVIWNTHGHNPSTLLRSGWTPEVIRVGDRISMTGDMTRDGSSKLFIRTVTLANGRTLLSAPGADNRSL